MNTKKITAISFVLLIILFFQPSIVSAVFGNGQGTAETGYPLLGFVLLNQVQDTVNEYNLTLQVKDWDGKIAFGGLNVTVSSSNGTVVASKLSNSTGHVFLQLEEGVYSVSVRSESRLVGYQEISVTTSETVTIRTWAYSLNVTLIDEENKPLTNHEVFLYDQIVFQPQGGYTVMTGQVGELTDKIETDVNGTASFFGVWNGTYGIRDADGGVYGTCLLSVQEPTEVTLKTGNLTVVCVDQENQPLQDYIVFLYEYPDFYISPTVAATDDRTGLLLNWVKTNENGTAYFDGLWNGTFCLKVVGVEQVGREVVNVQETGFFTIKCSKTYMALTFTTLLGEPLVDATVYIHNSAGDLVYRDRTDQNGGIFHESVYLDIYRIYLYWMGTQVWSGAINTTEVRELTTSCPIYTVVFSFVDQFGNPLADADATLRMRSQTTWVPFIEMKTDAEGRCTQLLPAGTYQVSCAQKIYATNSIVSISHDGPIKVACSIQSTIWLLTFFVALPLVLFSLVVERKKIKAPMEIKRYRTMLMKLGSMYNNGQVEYKIYRKLKEEYEAKLMELGGRVMR